MRAYLTNTELKTEIGKQLLELTVRIAIDGKLNLPEIKELRAWLRSNKDKNHIVAVGYLHDIMARITADGVIDRDELFELHLAIERVIPASHRTPIIQARKKRNAARLERRREVRRTEKEKEDEELRRVREEKEEEYARQMRLRHTFAKIAGVTFPNDDGTERQDIITRCKIGEQLILRHDENNAYSLFATQVLRMNGEQLGHAPEYLAERICNEIEAGYKVVGVLKDITGGTWDKPTLGVNFAVFFVAQDVTGEELEQYANNVFAGQA